MAATSSSSPRYVSSNIPITSWPRASVPTGKRIDDFPGVPVANALSSARAAALGKHWLLAWPGPSAGMVIFPEVEKVGSEDPSAVTAMASDGAGAVLILAQRAVAEGRWTVSTVVLRRVTDAIPPRRHSAR